MVEDISFLTDTTEVAVYHAPGENAIVGSVLIDELGFFQIGFSPYEIQGLDKEGLKSFLKVMPVDPQGKIATTWANLKVRR